MTKLGKILIGLVATAALFVLAYIIGLIYLFSGMCGSHPHKAISSPNGRYKAVIYQFDCGAPSEFSTHVSILNAGDELRDEPGNIFRADGHPDESSPEITWLDDEHLSIQRRPNIQVYSQEESWGWFFNRVNVTYK